MVPGAFQGVKRVQIGFVCWEKKIFKAERQNLKLGCIFVLKK